jgi:hypothetical protein
MSATALREKRQTTIPQDICEAAGLTTNDQIDWSFQDGEIRARKLVAKEPRKIVRRLVKRDGGMFLDIKGLTIDPDDIGKAIREERDSR